MPRRPEQFEEIREKSREKILTAALELFAHNGYSATSIDSIAKKAGISKGLIYNYYESKKSILEAIFEDVMSQGEMLMSKISGERDPMVKVKNMIETFFEMMGQNPEYLKLLMMVSLQPGVLEDASEFTNEMFRRNKELVSSIFDKGKNKDPMKGLMLDALMDGVMINFIRYGNQYPLDALKARIIEEFSKPKVKTK